MSTGSPAADEPKPAGDGLRRRKFSGDHANSGDAGPGHLPGNLTKTQEAALEFDPGNLSVRFTIFRDILAVLRSRYMGIVYRLAQYILIAQLCV